MALVDSIPDDPFTFIKNAPAASTKRVYGRILYSDDSAAVVPPSVQLTGFPVYDAADEAHIFGRPYDAKLVDPGGTTPQAGIWYADIPVFDDPDFSPSGVYATISHPSWTADETRRVLSTYAAKVRWIDCALATPLPGATPVVRQWIGGGNVVILGASENPPSNPVSGVLYARLTP